MNKFEDLLIKRGLYEKIEIFEDDYAELKKLRYSEFHQIFRIDSFCVKCNEHRTFESVDKEVHENSRYIGISTYSYNEKEEIESLPQKFARLLNKRYCISFRCTRHTEHIMLFDLITTDKHIIKIGQYPSYADIAIGDLEKYKAVLKDEFIEFSKAIGLFSHGIGIGAFIYLRRIIESLVFSQFEKYKNDLVVDDKVFKSLDFKGKIEILSEFLPNILVDNKNIYSILSLGVHQLDEEKCKEIFPYMRLAIELILDDIIVEKERESKEKLIKKQIAKLTGELK